MSRKVRFSALNPLQAQQDDEELQQTVEDQLLEADIDGNSRKRRQEVKLAYSDSSDDEADGSDPGGSSSGVAGRRKPAKPDSDDMFASDDEAEAEPQSEPQAEPQSKQANKLLDIDQFERENEISATSATITPPNSTFSAEILRRFGPTSTTNGSIKSTNLGNPENPEDTGDSDDSDDGPLDINYYVDPSEESISTQTLGSRPRKAEPQLESFTLKTDAEEGVFDADLNFIKKADDKEHQDRWLDGIRKAEIRKAKEAEQRRRDREAAAEAADADGAARMSVPELLGQLIPLLEPTETPAEALQRLNTAYRRAKPVRRRKRGANGSEELPKELPEGEKPTEHIETTINSITQAVDALLHRGMTGVYEMPREMCMRVYQKQTGEQYGGIVPQKRSFGSEEEAENVADNVAENIADTETETATGTFGTEQAEFFAARPNDTWEFKWDAGDDTHGPHTSEEMEAWATTYFRPEVLVRNATEGGEFVPFGDLR